LRPFRFHPRTKLFSICLKIATAYDVRKSAWLKENSSNSPVARISILQSNSRRPIHERAFPNPNGMASFSPGLPRWGKRIPPARRIAGRATAKAAFGRVARAGRFRQHGGSRMSNESKPSPGGQFLVYQTEDGKLKIDVRLQGETVWLTQMQTAELFQTTKQNVGQHLKNILTEEELAENSVVKDLFT
jgi:hypothetical protein